MDQVVMKLPNKNVNLRLIGAKQPLFILKWNSIIQEFRFSTVLPNQYGPVLVPGSISIYTAWNFRTYISMTGGILGEVTVCSLMINLEGPLSLCYLHYGIKEAISFCSYTVLVLYSLQTCITLTAAAPLLLLSIMLSWPLLFLLRFASRL